MRSLRTLLGMNVIEFGKLFGKSDATICQWENCNTKIPELALKLLEILEKKQAHKLKRKIRSESKSTKL